MPIPTSSPPDLTYQAVQVVQALHVGRIAPAVFLADLDLVRCESGLLGFLGGDADGSVWTAG